MPTSRQYGRSERQQAYAAARAVQAMARKLRGKKLSNKEARALTHLAAAAAGGSARSAEAVTLGRKFRSKKRRRSAIRSETRSHVRSVTGERSERRRRKGRKGRKGRRSGSSSAVFGPVPFASQPRRTRKRYLREWKRKGYRRTRRYS